MPNNNETTTRFRVDISELKKAMQEARRQIQVANSEFKAASSAMDNWATSSDGLRAKLNQLDTNLKSQKTILNSLEQQYEAVVREQGEGSAAADRLKIAINNQRAAVNRTEREINTYNQQLERVSQAEQEAARTGRSVEDVLNDTGDAAEEAGSEAKSSSGGWSVLKGALADLVADGIKAVSNALKDLVTDSDNAYKHFSAATGVAAESMGKYEKAIQNVYKNNFGESLSDVAEKMAKVKEVTGELDPSKLEDMTEKALTLEDTFGMDMTETLRGVQSLVNHFGMSSEEAFDYIAKGAQNGLNYTDELGDNVAEYAGKFAEAGYTADEYFQLLQNGSQGGAYNLDKVNDAINEATTRLGDGTIEENLGSFSQSTQDAFKAWQEGRGTQKAVVDSIVSDIKGAKSEQEKMNLAAAAFGTMAEDGGTKFIESLSSIGDSFTDVKGKADEIADIKYDTPLAALQGIGRTLKVDLLQPLVDKLTPVLSDLANWVTKNLPTFIEKVKEVAVKLKEWVPIIVGIGAAIATYFAVTKIIAFIAAIKSGELALKAMALAQKALNLVMSLNPIGVVIALIAGLVVAFVLLWKKSEAFRNFWINLWKKIQAIVSDGVKAITKFFSNLWNSITTKFSQLASWFNTNVIQPIVKFFSGLWNTLKTGASNAWNGISGVFKGVASWFNNTLIQPVSKFFSNMWNGLKNGASNAWSGIKQTFGTVATFFKTTFEKAWTAVKNVFSTGGKIFDGIKEGIVSAFTSIVNAIIRGINKVVSVPFDGINWALNKIKSIEILGKKPFNWIADISVPKIPELYRGGVLKKGQVGYLEGNGDEAVVPLDKNTGWLDEVANRIVDKGGMMGGTAQAQTVNNNYNYEYNQTNNSPKSLSRLEIYRQSKNLLGYAGGV